MFQIDDQFLASVGYEVGSLDEQTKRRYISEITEALNERISLRLVGELSDEQVEEFNEIQENTERARAWLTEFHSDFEEKSEFRKILVNVDSESEAVSFYAAALWMRDAVPNYGGVIQEELDAYQKQLMRMRQAANDAIPR